MMVRRIWKFGFAALVLALAGAGVGRLPLHQAWAADLPSATSSRPPAESSGSASASGFSHVRDFLHAHCLECHNDKKQKGDVSLEPFTDEGSVLKDRKTWDDVLEKVRAGEMPPKKKPRPDQIESDNFIHIVEGIFYRFDKNHPIDPGHVTIRRLNRVEYDHTIHDLLGIDATPSDDFPSDDVGHGFDNIGEVLSVSPVLIERYMAAADMVVDLAIPVEPLPPTRHYLSGRFLEPRTPHLPDKEHPALRQGQSLGTKYDVPDDGEYRYAARVYPDPSTADGDPIKVALLLDGKELETFEVVKAERKKPKRFEVKVQLAAGEHQFGVKLVSAPLRHDGKTLRFLRVNGLEVLGPPGLVARTQRALLKCDANASRHDQTREVLRRFASRAYRRPAVDAEVDRLTTLAETEAQADGKWERGIAQAMKAVLVSPKFLFRVELDDRPQSAQPHPIDEYQLASRLSYFIWSSMPDEELLDLASRNQLSANLEPQVRRMLKDPRAAALVDSFAVQWLQLRRLRTMAPDEDLFPDFNEKLRQSMLKETTLFVGSIIQEDRSILELIDCDYTFLNGPLAKHYGIADVNGNPRSGKRIADKGARIESDDFVRVHLGDHRRGGVLTQASVLCVTSNPTRTSPVKRGKFVLEQILGVPPPPPPPNVPPLPADAQTVATLSLRQRMEQHRANPACANCHEQMDGIGFAFENFDAVGAWRVKDGEFPIDASGTTPDGSSFNGVGELKQMLMRKKDLFARCLTKKMMTYALGRGTESYDSQTINRIVTALGKNDYTFSTLMIEIAKSDPFRLRRGKEIAP